MTLSLRYRILLTLTPLVLLLVALGGSAIALLHQLGHRMEASHKDFLNSMIFMQRFTEGVEGIDGSFEQALEGDEVGASAAYRVGWEQCEFNLQREGNNITAPGEGELVDRLRILTREYHRRGDAFYARSPADPARRSEYSGRKGLQNAAKELRMTAARIVTVNQDAMVRGNGSVMNAMRTSRLSLVLGVLAAVAAAVLFAWRTANTIVNPLRRMTESARAIGAGNLDQLVPVQRGDELGKLAEAFNTMARQLREYRQSNYARLLRAQRTSQATIDAFPDPVLVVDAEGKVETANPAACSLLGVRRGDGEAAPFVAWETPTVLREPLAAALGRQTPYLPEGFDRVIPLLCDGQQCYFLPRVLPIHDPGSHTLGAAVLLQNVTRLRVLDEVKTDLVATVSHELKTPLTGIRLVLHFLLEESAGPLQPKQTELLMDARDNAERLLARIDNLLDLARLEQRPGRLALRPECPADLLEAAAAIARPRAVDKNVQLNVQVSRTLPLVGVDAPRFAHVLANLLDNALTYTGRGGRIALEAQASSDRVILSVTDTGTGIPAESVPFVFDKFYRVPGESRGQGTGLGLAIVREIVQGHGGTVSCESSPGEGTAFRISLPFWRGPLSS